MTPGPVADYRRVRLRRRKVEKGRRDAAAVRDEEKFGLHWPATESETGSMWELSELVLRPLYHSKSWNAAQMKRDAFGAVYIR